MYVTHNRYIFSLVLLLIFNSQIVSQVDFTSSNIPIISINTNGQEILDQTRITANMKIINKENSRNYLNQSTFEYDGPISIEIRGNTSQSFPKKQYGIETQNIFGSNNNVSLLGLPSENDWVLNTSYPDKSLMRNVLAYQLWESFGHYAPRTRLCELIINGDYKGVYTFTEKIKRDVNRVDISKLNPNEINGDDVTGGYIIKIDRGSGNSGTIWQSKLGGISFQYEYPKHDEIVTEQRNYIRNYIDSLEQSLVSDNFMDAEDGYRKFIDEQSFVDFFIINEVSKNVDGYILSCFLYKDKDSKGGKLRMGPIWDFDLAFGNAKFREGFSTSGFQVKLNQAPWWWDKFLQDSIFISNIESRWRTLRANSLSDSSICSTIDSLSTLLDEAQARNFERWDIMGHYTWPNYYIGKSFKNEVNLLKAWTLDRLRWLDNNLRSDLEEDFVKNIETSVYPNPFSNYFTSFFSLSELSKVSITLYDLKGTRIAEIIDNEYFPRGDFYIDWNSFEIPNSMYIIELNINNEIISREKLVKI